MLEISIIRCCVEIVASPSNRITMQDPVSSETKQSAKNNYIILEKTASSVPDGDGMVAHRTPSHHMARAVHHKLEPVKVTKS